MDTASDKRPKGLVIVGPTASGKTGLAIALAHALAKEHRMGEVINADSMQIYTDLPIITAIPDEDERDGIPHHGFQVMDGGARCSVGHWLDLTRAYGADIICRDHIPILVGGTGMYIRAALEGISPIPDIDPQYRDAATALHAKLGGAGFRKALADYDPELAARLHDGDTQRLIRGMEVALATGEKLSDLQAIPPQGAIDLDWITIKLVPEREALYDRINRRYPLMLDQGGLDEIKAFAARNLDPNLPLMKAVGLPPMLKYLTGEKLFDEAVEDACRDSRRYAKRQTTWFNNQLQANICQEFGDFEQYSESFFEKILSKITNKG